MNPSAIRFLNKLRGVRNKSNGGWTAFCPGHDDRKERSLSIDESGETLLVKCFVGCTAEKIMAAVGLEVSDLFADTTPREHREQGRETVYHITPDIDHVRIDYPDGAKRFIWRTNGALGLKGIKTEDLPLYGLQRIKEGHTAEGAGECIIVTEGEKASDSLWDRGWVALGTVTGAAGCPSPKMLLPLLEGFPLLWPDEDEPGLRHMERVARNIAFGNCPFIIRVPGARKGEDAADFTGDIGELVGAAVPWEEGMLWKEGDKLPEKEGFAGW